MRGIWQARRRARLMLPLDLRRKGSQSEKGA